MDITFKHLEHRYGVGTPFEETALRDVNVEILSHTFLGVIGHTGSGKSTLVQHVDGLLKPTAGSLTVGEHTIRAGEKPSGLRQLRKQVGMVFQYPEHQLFEETVGKDIAFGPRNFGASRQEISKKTREAITMVGLDESFLEVSPFDLSGGQKRRVAIAGVLAVDPKVLILDEPTAGLDPRGQREIMALFASLHEEKQLTTLLVTHNMDDVATHCDDVLVMNAGSPYLRGTPQELFADPVPLQEVGLDIPESVQVTKLLEEKFGVTLPKDRFSVNGVAALARDVLGARRGTPE